MLTAAGPNRGPREPAPTRGLRRYADLKRDLESRGWTETFEPPVPYGGEAKAVVLPPGVLAGAPVLRATPSWAR